MKTVGDAFEKLNDACDMIDKLANDVEFKSIPTLDREDLILLLRDYCALIRALPIKQ